MQHATPKERENWQLLGDGYAIEWPDLDEHIGIEGLLARRRKPQIISALACQPAIKLLSVFSSLYFSTQALEKPKPKRAEPY